MSDVEAVLRKAASDLRAARMAWAVVGAIAVGVRSEPRFTRDVDVVVVVPGDPEAERLVADLRHGGYGLLALMEQEATRRLAGVSLVPPGGEEEGPSLDLIFALGGIEPEIVRDAETVEVTPGLSLPIAATGHLIALKLLARGDGRPQDVIDLRLLLAGADGGEISRAREAVRLIVERGFGRGRDLVDDLEAALLQAR